MRIRHFLPLAALALAPATLAQPFALHDLESAPQSSQPASFVTVGTTTFFTAIDPVNGQALWKTDGTPGGTVLVKDPRPDDATGQAVISGMRVVGSRVVFGVQGINQYALWASDGTDAGTAPITAGGAAVVFTNGTDGFYSTGTTAYFYGNSTAQNVGLWKTDGTAAGTVLVKQMSAFAPQSVWSFQHDGSRLYLLASEFSGLTSSLWVSDGTDAGTVKLADFTGTSSTISQRTRLLGVFGGTLYLAGASTAEGTELWKSDGSAAGTVRVKDINAGAANASPSAAVWYNGALYFGATTADEGKELWKTDGTEAGTVLVRAFNPGTATSAATPLGVAGGRLVVAANDGSTVGYEPWVGDGTTFALLKDLNPTVGPRGGFTGDPIGAVEVNGQLFFNAGYTETPITGESSAPRLWIRTDGTTAGTVPAFSAAGLAVGNATWTNGRWFFAGATAATGSEPYAAPFDGTSATLLRDIHTGTNASNPTALFAFGDRLVFSATTTPAASFWTSTGPPDSDTPVRVAAASGTNPVRFAPGAVLGGTMLGAAFDPATGGELWASDGTQAGTRLVKDLAAGTASSFPGSFVAFNGRVYFVANDGASGLELWSTDGTDAGTVRVKDVNAGSGNGLYSGAPLVEMGGALYFPATDASGGQELWKTDGTEAGTVRVKDILPGTTGSFPKAIFPFGSRLLFVATDSRGEELWGTDGTEAGTVLVKDFTASPFSSQVRSFVEMGGSVYFTANHVVSSGGRQTLTPGLWKTNGSGAGTVLVKSVNVGTNVEPRLAVAGGRLVFNGYEYVATGSTAADPELWTSDGTTAGTVLLKDLNPGAAAGGALESRPENFFRVGNTVVFTATTAGSGRELWKTDGTAAGTVMLQDLNAGAGSAFTANETVPFALVGSTLFFTADDGLHGQELWSGTLAGVVANEGDGGALGAGLSVWPQPARSAATLRLTAPQPGRATVRVFDLLGREHTRIVQDVPAGDTDLALDASRLAPGMYVVRAALPGDALKTARLVVAR